MQYQINIIKQRNYSIFVDAQPDYDKDGIWYFSEGSIIPVYQYLSNGDFKKTVGYLIKMTTGTLQLTFISCSIKKIFIVNGTIARKFQRTIKHLNSKKYDLKLMKNDFFNLFFLLLNSKKFHPNKVARLYEKKILLYGNATHV